MTNCMLTFISFILFQEVSKESIDFLVSKLSGMDQSIMPSVLQEIRGLGQAYQELLTDCVDQISRLCGSGSSAVRLIIQQMKEDVSKR